MSITSKPIKVYDIEVVDGYLILSHITLGQELIETMVNPTRTDVQALFDSYLMTGFNNQGYDDKILYQYVTSTQNLKRLSDDVIAGNRFLPRSPFETLDLRHLLLNHHPSSLKKWESALGLAIHQGEEYFNLPRHEQDLYKLTSYCESDVRATLEVYHYLEQDGSLEAYMGLVDYVEKDTGVRALGSRNYLTKLLLTPDIGESTHYNHKNLADYLKSCGIKHWLPLFWDYIKFAEVGGFKRVDMEHFFSSKRVTQRGKYVPTAFNQRQWDGADNAMGDYIASRGGAHYLNEAHKHAKNVIAFDIASLYPSVMVKLNLFGDLTNKVADLMDIRVKAKKTNPKLAGGLKLALNSLYGITRSEQTGDHLFTRYGVDTCLVGNVLFFDMLKRFEAIGATVLQINTDAIFVDADTCTPEQFQKLTDDFMRRTGLLAETFTLTNYHAIDVNNYFTDEKGKGIFSYNKLLADMTYIPKRAQAIVRKSPPFTYIHKLDDFMRRATATGKYTHALFDYELEPRISEKTGKVLKGYNTTLTNPEPVGKTIRGYVSQHEQDKVVSRTCGDKESKVSKVNQLTFKLLHDKMDLYPSDLDIHWYREEAEKLAKKIGGYE